MSYYPFGMQQPTRNFNSPNYRYGFQGQEKDSELKGEGNSINYKYRMHDPRIGRFFAVDPLAPEYPFYSPYHFAGNNTIRFIEFEGLEQGDYYVKEFVNDNGDTHIQLISFIDNGENAVNRMFVLDPNATQKTPNRLEYNGKFFAQTYISRNSDFYGEEDFIKSEYLFGLIISDDDQAFRDAGDFINNAGKYTDDDYLERLVEVNNDDKTYLDVALQVLTRGKGNNVKGLSVGISVLKNSGGKKGIKEIVEKYSGHIFSSKHIKKGVLLLGKSKDDILKNVSKTIEKVAPKLKEGANQIETVINGHTATIRTFVQKGKVVSVNAFKGKSIRKIGNTIDDTIKKTGKK